MRKLVRRPREAKNEACTPLVPRISPAKKRPLAPNASFQPPTSSSIPLDEELDDDDEDDSEEKAMTGDEKGVKKEMVDDEEDVEKKRNKRRRKRELDILMEDKKVKFSFNPTRVGNLRYSNLITKMTTLVTHTTLRDHLPRKLAPLCGSSECASPNRLFINVFSTRPR